MSITRDQGIVLRTYSFGEADKVVILVSPNHGKLRTVAKGVRKTKSRFGGRLEPYTHVDLVLYEGRTLDTITQVSVIEAYPRMRSDYDAVMAAAVMAEVVDASVQEGQPAVGLFLALQRGLAALDDGRGSPDLLTAFLLRAAEAIGLTPALRACAGCGRRDDGFRFSISAGGVVCDTCAPPGAAFIEPSVVELMAELAGSDLRTLRTEPSPSSEGALRLTRRFYEHHLDRRLRSLAVHDG